MAQLKIDFVNNLVKKVNSKEITIGKMVEVLNEEFIKYSPVNNWVEFKKEPLIERAKDYADWLSKLNQVAADKLNISPSEVKINDDEAVKYYNDGFTPAQCFRESF